MSTSTIHWSDLTKAEQDAMGWHEFVRRFPHEQITLETFGPVIEALADRSKAIEKSIVELERRIIERVASSRTIVVQKDGPSSAAFEARIAALEQQQAADGARITQLEERIAATKWLGIWESQTAYKAGNFVTHDGSTWTAQIDSRGLRPGSGNAGWTLCAKKGRDAR